MTINANIWKLYVIKASKWLMLFMPIIWLFYKENGLDVSDLFLIQGIYSFTIAVIEIPSGYVADVLGRKNSLIIGTFFGVVGMIIYSFSFGFEGFLFAALSLGIGQSFLSGSDTALMYDSLVELNRSKDFIKFEGRTISMGNLAEAAAGFIGAYFLTQSSYRTPFYYQIGIAAIGFFVALTLVEPSSQKIENGKSKPWKNIKNIIRYALYEKPTLRLCILYSSIMGTATLTIAWFSQPLLDFLEIEGKYNGLIFGVLNLAVAATAYFAHYIEEKINTKIILVGILILITSSYFVLYWKLAIWSLAILFFFYLVRGIATPILRDYQNRFTPSEMRATVMSIRSFIIRILFSIVSPMIGYIAEVYTLQQAFLLSGGLFLFLGSLTLLFLLKKQITPIN
ncbi:MAG: MFS transporter [Vicingaceae bacterium]